MHVKLLSPLDVLDQLDAAADMYENIADAWHREHVESAARINRRAAIVCRETRDALAQLRDDEAADLGIGGGDL